ncbi:MAG: UDPGP type 1 family protein [Planctomycetota bacterium]
MNSELATTFPTLVQYDQQQVLRFWDQLDSAERDRLRGQVDALDLEQLARLIGGQDDATDFESLAARAATPPAVGADGSGMPWSVDEAGVRGEQALRDGKVAAILVAGGQGTRLGFDLPKGMFPIGPVSGKTLFQVFADKLLAKQARYGVKIPWYIMTSEATDQPTREYFEANDYLGLDAGQIRIFKQGTMPAVDAATGKILLADRGSIALSPDGHGGTVAALSRSGCLADAKSRGIEQLFYFQVDNPLVTLCDHKLIGHHLLAGSQITTQVVRKRYPKEKVGIVVQADDQVRIIEYSDLPDQAAEATDADGRLKLWAGNIAVHVIDIDFLESAANSESALPYHRASKKVPHVDSSGQLVSPTEPNAIKFERFIFDLLPAAKTAIVVEVKPEEAFAPVKNADGAANDTPGLAKKAIVALHRQWLEEAGVAVDSDVQVEIDPRLAESPEELAANIDTKSRISQHRYLSVD